MKGSEFANEILNLVGKAREDAIIAAVKRGAVPPFIHSEWWYPVKIDGRLEVFVAPDYFSIGDNSDYLRVAANPYTAQEIADHYHAMLPTRKLVNDIWKASTQKIAPRPFPPDTKMELTPRMIESNTAINTVATKPGSKNLLAGHKKDVVIGPNLDGTKVAIYGWHQLDGKPIQPYSTIHGSYYADYAHGVRLVSRKAFLDGKEVDLLDVLADPEASKLISDQGHFSGHFPNLGGGTSLPPAVKVNYTGGTVNTPAVPPTGGSAAGAIQTYNEQKSKDSLFTIITVVGFGITLIGFLESRKSR